MTPLGDHKADIVAALTKPDPLPPHSAIDRNPDYYDPAQAAADAAYRRKTISEPGYDPGARAAYCCQCRIGAREGWKPADKAPRRCRGYEPVTPAAIIRKAAADGVTAWPCPRPARSRRPAIRRR